MSGYAREVPGGLKVEIHPANDEVKAHSKKFFLESLTWKTFQDPPESYVLREFTMNLHNRKVAKKY